MSALLIKAPFPHEIEQRLNGRAAEGWHLDNSVQHGAIVELIFVRPENG